MRDQSRRPSGQRYESEPLRFGRRPVFRHEGRLRELWGRIGMCLMGQVKQPRPFTDGKAEGSPYRYHVGNLPHYRAAFDLAPDFMVQRCIVEACKAHLYEELAELDSWLEADVIPFPDARRMAQERDSAEDIAQERFACDPTSTNAEAHYDAIVASHEADKTLMASLRRFFRRPTTRTA